MITHETKDSKEFYECKHGHRCQGEEIPEYGLDIYCPTCLRSNECSPLDLIIDDEPAGEVL